MLLTDPDHFLTDLSRLSTLVCPAGSTEEKYDKMYSLYCMSSPLGGETWITLHTGMCWTWWATLCGSWLICWLSMPKPEFKVPKCFWCLIVQNSWVDPGEHDFKVHCLPLQDFAPLWEPPSAEEIMLCDFNISCVILEQLLHEFLARSELKCLVVFIGCPGEEGFICPSASSGHFWALWVFSFCGDCDLPLYSDWCSQWAFFSELCTDSHQPLVRGDIKMCTWFLKHFSDFSCSFGFWDIPLCKLANQVNTKFTCAGWLYCPCRPLICSCGSQGAFNWHWGMMWAKWKK